MDGIKILDAKDIPKAGSPGVCALEAAPLYGEVTESRLFACYPAWREARENYQPRPGMIGKLKTVPEARVTVFLGPWCPDSGREIPRFYRIVDLAGLRDRLEISLWVVDRNKTLPNTLMQDYGITHVPTFVFEREGRELGRIVERPATSGFEEDMWNILKP